MTRSATTTIERPISNTHRRRMLLMGMIGADEPDNFDDRSDTYEQHNDFESRKDVFV